MKTFDIIALGELNVDLILNQIESEPEIGKEKFAKQMTLTLGSSTAIFAANAAALGAKVAFCGMIGNDSFGDLVESSLKAKGVDTRYLIRQDKYATGATICMSYDEDRANLTDVPGSHGFYESGGYQSRGIQGGETYPYLIDFHAKRRETRSDEDFGALQSERRDHFAGQPMGPDGAVGSGL